MEPLHVHLTHALFAWYFQGKEYELRIARGIYSPHLITPNRHVVIHKGQTSDHILGRIGDKVVGSLEEITEQIDFKKIAPPIDSLPHFLAGAYHIFGRNPSYIAFQVVLNPPVPIARIPYPSSA